MKVKEKKYNFIYKTTNNLSGRYYYGMHSTDNLNDGYLGSGTQLKRSINKYGKQHFTIEIIEFCKDRVELKSKESQIVTLKEIAKKECMNMRVGGGGMDYKPPISEETRKKMSEAQKKRPIDWDTIEKMSKAWLGKKHTLKTREKISKNNMGKTHTTDTKKHLSELMFLRWEISEMRNKYSQAAKKRPSNRKGVVLSDETKLRISQNKKGKKIKPQEKVVCPNCKKIGSIGGMKRYHFDNCVK